MFPFSLTGKTKTLSFFPHPTGSRRAAVRVLFWDTLAVLSLMLSVVAVHSEGGRTWTSEAFCLAPEAGSPLTK